MRAVPSIAVARPAIGTRSPTAIGTRSPTGHRHEVADGSTADNHGTGSVKELVFLSVRPPDAQHAVSGWEVQRAC